MDPAKSLHGICLGDGSETRKAHPHLKVVRVWQFGPVVTNLLLCRSSNDDSLAWDEGLPRPAEPIEKLVARENLPPRFLRGWIEDRSCTVWSKGELAPES
jgi:hypothetical protein